MEKCDFEGAKRPEFCDITASKHTEKCDKLFLEVMK